MTKFNVKSSGLMRVFAAYPKNGASWKKSYVVCMVGSCYYSF